jgi:FAD/FMN-containing dehydrogenase
MARAEGEPGMLAADLAKRLNGEVLTPSHPDFDGARGVWNGCIDRHPAAVVRCRSTADVAEVVGFTRDLGLPLAVRGGGHSLPGFSTCDDGIVLDLSPMRGVRVDPEARVARGQGGCRWGDYDTATHAHGLASTGGLISTTGIAGLTLGGGIGWLTRRYGLACDNLLSAEVVTASGDVLRASASEHSDLFWGLRGGGGNFGVVTEFEFRVHPVSTVMAGLTIFPRDRGLEVARFYRDYVASLSDDFTTMLVFLTAPSEPFVPAGLRGQLAVAIVGCYCGPTGDADSVLSPVRSLDPAVDLFEPMPYPGFQSMFDADLPAGDRYYFKGGFLLDCSDAVVEVISEFMARRPSLRSEFDLHHMGGAAARVAEDETAFADRTAAFTYNILAIWDNPRDDHANRTWARAFAAELDRSGTGRAYVNFLSDATAEGDIRGAYGDQRYRRLVELKRTFDPTNLFRLNQNVRP